VAAIAAGDRTTTVTVTVAPVPDFTIAATPNAISVAQAGTGNATVNLVRTNLTADVALSLVTPPAGITGGFTPATLTGATLASALVISVAGSVAPGVYPVTVQGTGGGVTKTTVVTVTVVSGPTVSLVAAPAALAIEQGASGQSTLTATRTNYTANIVPSATGQPGGMVVTFNPNPLTANTSTITVAVGGGVALGTYNLTITGASGVAGNPTTPLQVTVTAPTGTSIEWDFCDLVDAPVKFWRKSGGSWSEVTPTVVGTVTKFNFTISGATGGIAFTQSATSAIRTASSKRRSSINALTRRAFQRAEAARSRPGTSNAQLTQTTDYETFLFLGSTSDLQGTIGGCNVTPPTTVMKHFTTTGQPSTEEGQLGYGGAPQALTSMTTSYDLTVTPATYDWLALFGPTPGLPTLAHNWQQYRIGRAEAAPGGTVTIDRAGAPALTQFPFTVSGGAGGSFWYFSEDMSGARGDIGSWQIGSPFNMTGTGNMFFVAPGDRIGTDMVTLYINNVETIGSDEVDRTSFNYFGSAPPGSGSFALPQGVPAYTLAPVVGAPVPTWSVSGNTPTDYQAGEIFVEFFGAGSVNSYFIEATRAWLNANGFTTNYTLAGETLPGFLAMWAPAGPLSESAVGMFGSNFNTPPTAGTVQKTSSRLQDP
jgi:hypothetical protein